MESFTRINVARGGHGLSPIHYFRIDVEDGNPYFALIRQDIEERFPQSEGFYIDVTRWEASGRTLA